jgi:hypothetical protein
MIAELLPALEPGLVGPAVVVCRACVCNRVQSRLACRGDCGDRWQKLQLLHCNCHWEISSNAVASISLIIIIIIIMLPIKP